MTALETLRAEGATHIHWRSPDVSFVYRPTPSFPGQWGQKVIIRREQGWHLAEPWILRDTLPEGVRPIGGE